jgi:cytochrome c
MPGGSITRWGNPCTKMCVRCSRSSDSNKIVVGVRLNNGQEIDMRMVRFVSLVSSAAVLLTLSACGGGEQKSAESKSAEAPAATEPAANAAAAATPVAYSSLTGVAANGEKVFAQCKACHVLEAGQNRVGPSLSGIIGRKAGSVEGFTYSAANKSSGKVWDEETLYTYLESPQQFMPGTKMIFAGLKKPQDRADVIAYLKSAAK